MRTKATGVALHYFDAGAGQNGSDKFYRIYVFKTTSRSKNTTYTVIGHWGRDGAAVGQSKTMEFSTWNEAKNYAVKLGDSKMRKGYEWLGEKEVMLDTDDLTSTGMNLLRATGRTATKVNGFSLVIQEEADLLELLMA